MRDSEFLSANKMFVAKCKLYTKEMNPKPTHKSSIAAGDMLKLRGYFSEGLDSNNSWADPERLLRLWSPICDRNTDRTNKELSRRVEAKGPSLFGCTVCTRTRRCLIRGFIRILH